MSIKQRTFLYLSSKEDIHEAWIDCSLTSGGAGFPAGIIGCESRPAHKTSGRSSACAQKARARSSEWRSPLAPAATVTESI